MQQKAANKTVAQSLLKKNTTKNKPMPKASCKSVITKESRLSVARVYIQHSYLVKEKSPIAKTFNITIRLFDDLSYLFIYC